MLDKYCAIHVWFMVSVCVSVSVQACRENHVEVVKLLLDYGCNPSTPFPSSR